MNVKRERLGAEQVLFAADFMNVGDVFRLWDEDRMYPGGLWRGTLGMCFCNCTAAQETVWHGALSSIRSWCTGVFNQTLPKDGLGKPS